MSPSSPAGRAAVPPVAPGPELLIVRLRAHARRLGWSALLLIAVAGGVGYFYDNLPAPFENWMLLAAAGALVFFGVLVPLLIWSTRSTTITSRRVIARKGLFARHRAELSHTRGYTMQMRRGPLQRMWGVGDLLLDDGATSPLLLRNVPRVSLVHEVLSDQVEMCQIQAHRDSQGFAFGHPPLEDRS